MLPRWKGIFGLEISNSMILWGKGGGDFLEHCALCTVSGVDKMPIQGLDIFGKLLTSVLRLKTWNPFASSF